MRRLALVVVLGLLGGCDEATDLDAGVDGAVADGSAADGGPSDAGETDAGRADGGPMDAGAFDGGTADAGLSDAGLSDGGLSDGGLADAGPSDAGLTDAGPSDAGLTDAGPVDAGLSDAGLSDAGPDASVDGGVDPDDPDGDGVPTLTEVACGTDPGDISDFPRADTLRGDGSDLDPYRICLPEHLALFAAASDVLTAHARLGDDLDMRGVSLGPAIGTSSAPFTGVFGGDGFVIDGLSVGTVDAPRAGLFGHVGASGVVEGVILTNTQSFFGSVLVDRNEGTVRRTTVAGAIDADNHMGLVVNRNLASGTVEDCSSEGRVTGVRSHVGGLVGRNDGLVQRSFSHATVSGDNRTGGLVGSGAGTVRSCFATGDVSGTRKWIGGLVGSARDGALIENGYALGDVRAGDGEAGGVLGNIEGTAVLRFVYAQNTVMGSLASGGVLGVDSSAGDATVESCFFDAALTAADAVCTGLTATQLTMASSYVGFDFVDTWQIEASIRPTASLVWE